MYSIYFMLFLPWDWKFRDGGIWLWVTFAFSHLRPQNWQVLRKWFSVCEHHWLPSFSLSHIHTHMTLNLPLPLLLLMGMYPICVAHLLDICVRAKKGFLFTGLQACTNEVHIWSWAKINTFVFNFLFLFSLHFGEGENTGYITWGVWFWPLKNRR